MVDYIKNLTRLPIKGNTKGSVCEVVATGLEPQIKQMWEATARSQEEQAIGVVINNGEITHHTAMVEGRTKALTRSITSTNVSEIRKDVGRLTGIDDAAEFNEQIDDFIILHTHPGGDPSPSTADLEYMINQTEKVNNMRSEGVAFISSLPEPTGLLAVSKSGKDLFLITGFTVIDDLPGYNWIDFYGDEVSSIKIKSLPDFFDDEDKKETFQETRKEVYRQFIELITEESEGPGNPKILDRCHYVIRGSG